MNLTSKINMLIVCAVLLTGIIVGSLAVEATGNSFEDFTKDLWQYRIAAQSRYYSDYYVSNGNSWEGVQELANYNTSSANTAQRFLDITTVGIILTDPEGTILIHPEKEMNGGHISTNLLFIVRSLYLYIHKFNLKSVLIGIYYHLFGLCINIVFCMIIKKNTF